MKRLRPARPTGSIRKINGDAYRRFDDGSFRRLHPKVKGKAAVKAAKRLRQAERAA